MLRTPRSQVSIVGGMTAFLGTSIRLEQVHITDTQHGSHFQEVIPNLEDSQADGLNG
jgi:hypothetical protein